MRQFWVCLVKKYTSELITFALLKQENNSQNIFKPLNMLKKIVERVIFHTSKSASWESVTGE